MNADPQARRRLLLDVAGNLAALAFFAAAGILLWTAANGSSVPRDGLVVATVVAGLLLQAVAESVRRTLT
ncbi:MAG TPA: hypothetical protein VFD92_09915 [Candidatus Binatia bacterium]|nr:hypothetical protein [Candidatus Binatia bacterium]